MWDTILENRFDSSESCWIVTNTELIYQLVIIRCSSFYGVSYFDSV